MSRPRVKARASRADASDDDPCALTSLKSAPNDCPIDLSTTSNAGVSDGPMSESAGLRRPPRRRPRGVLRWRDSDGGEGWVDVAEVARSTAGDAVRRVLCGSPV